MEVILAGHNIDYEIIREIAAALYLSVRTVESHISSLLAKTGCRNRTQLVLLAPFQP
jgi:DNA-binding NarL/FixJ family response regulator